MSKKLIDLTHLPSAKQTITHKENHYCLNLMLKKLYQLSVKDKHT